jgi:hypothetical protein
MIAKDPFNPALSLPMPGPAVHRSPAQSAVSRPSDDELSEKARDAIRSGNLPNRLSEHTRGGRGAGSSCAVCGVRLLSHEIELAVEFTPAREGNRRESHFHARCFAAWVRCLGASDLPASAVGSMMASDAFAPTDERGSA